MRGWHWRQLNLRRLLDGKRAADEHSGREVGPCVGGREDVERTSVSVVGVAHRPAMQAETMPTRGSLFRVGARRKHARVVLIARLLIMRSEVTQSGALLES
jgi:hypothetical protein